MIYLGVSIGLGGLALLFDLILIGRAERLIAYLKDKHPKKVKKMGSLRFGSRGSHYPSVNPNLTSFLWKRQWQDMHDLELDRLCRSARAVLIPSRICWALFAVSLIVLYFVY